MATITELEGIVAKISVELAESHKKTDASLAESRKEVSDALKSLAEYQKETERILWETNNEFKKNMEKTVERMDERNDEFKKNMEKTVERMDERNDEFKKNMDKTVERMDERNNDFKKNMEKTLERMGENVGRVNERLGEIVELIVLPGLQDRMNDRGHNFTKSSPRVKYRKDGKDLAEIDLLLENGDEVMAVEAKARFKPGEMKNFVKKLELLRKEEKITGTTGKTIYAAAAAIRFDIDALKTAKKNGIYLVEIDDTDKTKLIPPEGKDGTW